MSRTTAEFVQQIRRMKADLGKVALGAVKTALTRSGIPMARAETLRREIVATSKFLNAWAVEPRPGGYALTNLSPEAGFIRWGRRPGRMPPIRAIMAWVAIKFGKAGPEGRSMAWAIAKKIAERGVKGRDVLRGIRPRLRERVKIEVLTAVQKRLQERS
jgi:hypothetical protein